MKALLVAGGSAGHLIPAMTLAEHLKSADQCMILSTSRPVDQIMAKASSLQWTTVDLNRLTPLAQWLSPRFALKQAAAVRRISVLLAQVHPNIVVGFGGYLSAVSLTAARLSGYPTVLHEQNLLPGRANRWMARWAHAVAVSFPETQAYLPQRARVEVTGNPVRFGAKGIKAQAACRYFGLDARRPVLLILGGSQGSSAINRLCLAMWQSLPPQSWSAIQVLHVAGRAEKKLVEEAYRRLGLEARVYDFLMEMHWALAAATLAVSRAGATTIAEMAALRLPAVLIPYPYAGGHQRANARWLEGKGGAVVLEESGLTPQQLAIQVDSLLNQPERLSQMRRSLDALSGPPAVERLGGLIRRLAK